MPSIKRGVDTWLVFKLEMAYYRIKLLFHVVVLEYRLCYLVPIAVSVYVQGISVLIVAAYLHTQPRSHKLQNSGKLAQVGTKSTPM
ncbi:hypothetical protein D3C73_1211330 [compost metagenome]